MPDKEFKFSVTKEGDSVVQEELSNKSSRYCLRPKYFGEYTEAIEYMTEEIKKFINNKEKENVKENKRKEKECGRKKDMGCNIV